MDILLLLSIFTGREVFVGYQVNNDEIHPPIRKDPRIHQFGNVLRKSISDGEKDKGINFEARMNQIYLLIRSDEWQSKYSRGYLLLLARQAFQYQTLESSFVQCWTIWEHLFFILNQKEMSDKDIRNQRAVEKISFLLLEYALRQDIDAKSREKIADLADIRNKLVHFGRFPEKDKVHEDAILFIHLTEFILAKILGLLPSDVFNTVEKLETFMKENNRQKSK